MWSPNELLKIEKQRDILSYITLQFFHFKKVPLEHCPLGWGFSFWLGRGGIWDNLTFSRQVSGGHLLNAAGKHSHLSVPNPSFSAISPP